MSKRQRRLRAALEEWFGVVVTVCFVAALVGGGLAYTAYATSVTETTQQPGPEVTHSGAFTHEAVVQQSNPVFDTGERLSNRRVYFTQLTPVLDGTFSYRYTAQQGGNVTVDGTLRLVTVSEAAGDTGEPITYWRETEILDRERASLAPGETLELEFSENVTRLLNESEATDAALGGTPGTIRTRIVADIEANGTANGDRLQRTGTYRLGIDPQGGVYSVSGSGPVTNTTRPTRTVQVQRASGPLGRIGGPLLGVVGLFGLLALGTARYRGAIALDAEERAYLNYEQARTEFDEWITGVELPAESVSESESVATVESLSGLVDIAIDSNRRVLRDGNRYLVTVDGVTYRYTAPPEPGPGSWTPLFGNRGTEPDDSWGEDEGEDAGEDEEEDGTQPPASADQEGTGAE